MTSFAPEMTQSDLTPPYHGIYNSAWYDDGSNAAACVSSTGLEVGRLPYMTSKGETPMVG